MVRGQCVTGGRLAGAQEGRDVQEEQGGNGKAGDLDWEMMLLDWRRGGGLAEDLGRTGCRVDTGGGTLIAWERGGERGWGRVRQRDGEQLRSVGMTWGWARATGGGGRAGIVACCRVVRNVGRMIFGFRLGLFVSDLRMICCLVPGVLTFTLKYNE